MGSIELRLQTIKYQLLKSYAGQLTDEEIVKMARNIYDQAISAGTIFDSPETMPIEALGVVSIEWDATGTIGTFTKGDKSISNDDLRDEVVPDIDAGSINAFQLGGENFELNGELFEVA